MTLNEVCNVGGAFSAFRLNPGDDVQVLLHTATYTRVGPQHLTQFPNDLTGYELLRLRPAYEHFAIKCDSQMHLSCRAWAVFERRRCALPQPVASRASRR
jgi:hypothetical protein